MLAKISGQMRLEVSSKNMNKNIHKTSFVILREKKHMTFNIFSHDFFQLLTNLENCVFETTETMLNR